MDLLSEKNLLEIKFTEESKSNLAVIAQWANINAIVGLVSMGISVFGTIKSLVALSGYGGSVISGTVIFTLMITIGVSLLVNLTLIAAAKNIKAGLASEDQGIFNFGMRKFKSYFLIMGILFIIAIVIVFIFLLIALTVGSMTH